MDVDLLNSLAYTLGKRVDQAMMDWEDEEQERLRILVQQWFEEHPDLDIDDDDEYEHAHWLAMSRSYGTMLNNWGWMLRFEARRQARNALYVGLIIGAAAGFLIRGLIQ